MVRVCSGCLKENPIVNDQRGFCDYCDKARSPQVKAILASADKIGRVIDLLNTRKGEVK